MPPMYLGLQNQLYDIYQDEAAKIGRKLAPGEGLGVLRDIIIADTDEEALELWAHGPAFCGATWFAPFGFDRVLREPGSVGPPTPQELMHNAMILVGTVDTVTRQMETW